MNKTSELVGKIYGASAADRISGQIEALLEKHRQSATKPSKSVLTARDVMLITYADQVSAPGQSPLRTLSDFLDAHLNDVVSAVHILPFYPWSSDDGFSVKDFFAVDPEFGDWPDVRRIGERFDLMFDAVFNHMSAQGAWFQHFLNNDPRFLDFFVTVEGSPDLSKVIRPRALPLLTEFQTELGARKVWTTFSADQVDLNFKNPEVLLATLDALLFYVNEGARFIRLDAIAFLWKEIGTTCLHLPQTHQVIQLMRAALNSVAPNVLLITETNVPHVDNISYFGDGTNEAQLVYNFALPPLVLHSLQTGNAEKLTRWAQSLKLPSEQVTWFNFLASHDGIGVNPARGILSDEEISAMIERVQTHGGFISYKNMPDGSQIPYEMNINYLDALSNPSRNEPNDLAARKLLTAHAIMLTVQGVPGIYFHTLFGSRGDRAGAESSGIKRRINRQKFTRSELDAQLTDSGSLRSHIFSGWKKLLGARRGHVCFDPAAGQEIFSTDPRLFVVKRKAGNRTVTCIHNISGEKVDMKQVGVATAKPEFIYRNGKGEGLELEPFATAWFS